MTFPSSTAGKIGIGPSLDRPCGQRTTIIMAILPATTKRTLTTIISPLRPYKYIIPTTPAHFPAGHTQSRRSLDIAIKLAYPHHLPDLQVLYLLRLLCCYSFAFVLLYCTHYYHIQSASLQLFTHWQHSPLVVIFAHLQLSFASNLLIACIYQQDRFLVAFSYIRSNTGNNLYTLWHFLLPIALSSITSTLSAMYHCSSVVYVSHHLAD